MGGHSRGHIESAVKSVGLGAQGAVWTGPVSCELRAEAVE